MVNKDLKTDIMIVARIKGRLIVIYKIKVQILIDEMSANNYKQLG